MLIIFLYVVVLLILETPKNYSHELEKYNTYWEIELPEYNEIIYKVKTPTHWSGDGLDFIVVKLKDTQTDFFEDFSQDNNYEQEMEDMFDLNKDELSIDSNYLPRWGENYLIKVLEKHGGARRLYLIFYPQDNELIICECRI